MSHDMRCEMRHKKFPIVSTKRTLSDALQFAYNYNIICESIVVGGLPKRTQVRFCYELLLCVRETEHGSSSPFTCHYDGATVGLRLCSSFTLAVMVCATKRVSDCKCFNQIKLMDFPLCMPIQFAQFRSLSARWCLAPCNSIGSINVWHIQFNLCVLAAFQIMRI